MKILRRNYLGTYFNNYNINIPIVENIQKLPLRLDTKQ